MRIVIVCTETSRRSAIALAAGFLICVLPVFAAVSVTSPNPSIVTIENAQVRFSCNLTTGYYAVTDVVRNALVLDYATWRINTAATFWASENPSYARTWSQADVSDAFGKGKTLQVVCTSASLPKLLLSITLYDNKGFAVLRGGVENTTVAPIRITRIRALHTGYAFPGHSGLSQNFRILDGNGGGENTKTVSSGIVSCRNNLMATFGSPGNNRTAVIGGLTYTEFEKFARAENKTTYIEVRLHAEDPAAVGKRVDPGTSYLPNDLFYLDFLTDNPFDALQQYGLAVRTAQKITLNMYTFPSFCLWYGVSSYSGPNDSAGAVAAADHIVQSGFLKYSPAAVRLVPDCSGTNNQQGWWDDAHWQMQCTVQTHNYGRYVEPYETTAKWAGALLDRGVIPLIYSQTGITSQDYAQQYPGHMLFNNTTKSFDYSDPAFLARLEQVYANLRSGGVQGLMFDYPDKGWAKDGGLEDVYATTAMAYRNIFRMAKEGLGPNSFIHERNLDRGSDVTLGLVDSQRVVYDTWKIDKEMIARCGLRWYKNRVVVNYDMDAKNLHDVTPAGRDGVRTMVTMGYVVSGRFLLGLGFNKMGNDDLYDLSRTFPYHTAPQSARPVDMLVRDYPRVYAFAVNPAWQQVTFYNDDTANAQTIAVNLSGDTAFNALGLDAGKQYYAYDFWNNVFIGKLAGSGTLSQTLRPGEARMMSLHEVKMHPQFISTDRHLMQGFVDLRKIKWDADSKTLRGLSEVIGGEPYTVVIALNGAAAKECRALHAKAELTDPTPEGLVRLVLDRPENGTVDWSVTFE